METLDRIIDALSDGKWHTIIEISVLPQFRKLTVQKLLRVLNFLKEYGFIELSAGRLKVDPLVQAFWREIRWIERSESAV